MEALHSAPWAGQDLFGLGDRAKTSLTTEIKSLANLLYFMKLWNLQPFRKEKIFFLFYLQKLLCLVAQVALLSEFY